MKKVFQLLLLLFPLGLMAQGVNFEHELTWKEVLAKAKAENKYIFMDCFTTWCGPCKYMSANIFPQAEVGSFFNKSFVSVKVQMDKTDRDNEMIKKWYEDAKMIEKDYGVNAYPTFLYFSPEGKLVHRVVGGGEAKAFIGLSANALDPAKQYYTQLELFNKKADKQPEDLRKMAIASKGAYDMTNASMYAKQYLATQKNLLTKENIEFINTFVSSSKDAAFEVFIKHPNEVDNALGKGAAAKKVKAIVMREDIPALMPKDKTTSPDWATMETTLKTKYPAYADEIMSNMKVQYAQSTKNWPAFQQEIVMYMNKYGANATPDQLNMFAWQVFENCPDMKCVGEALEWSKRSFKDKENPMYMDTYANILYKMGRKEEALAVQEKAVAMSNGDKSLQETLDKMKKGEKTWKN